MAIDIINKPLAPLSPNKAATNNAVDIKPKSPDNAAPIASEDSVVITSMAQNIQKSSDANTPPVNEQRIQKITAALQDGSYKANPERIAEKMLQLEFKLPDIPDTT